MQRLQVLIRLLIGLITIFFLSSCWRQNSFDSAVLLDALLDDNALMVASILGEDASRISTVKIASKEFAALDATASKGAPLLHIAVYLKADAVVQWYRDIGADILVLDGFSQLAGELALEIGEPSIAKILARADEAITEERLREFLSRRYQIKFGDDVSLNWRVVNPEENSVGFLLRIEQDDALVWSAEGEIVQVSGYLMIESERVSLY